MSIRSDNLKFYKALLNNDRDDSGGIPTGTEIPNVDNSIFPDISPLDRAMGRIFMRKVSPQVVTSDTEQYLGAHSIITKIPKDEKLAVFLFDSGEKSRYHDIRSEASSDFEAYRQRSIRYNGVLWDTHYEGTQTLTLYQTPDTALLEPNTVIYIEEKNSISTNQYIMVVTIDDKGVQTFLDADGQSFTKRVVHLHLSQPLNADYTGNPMSKGDTFTPNTFIHTTAVADASKIYSSKYLKVDASAGDLDIDIGTPYVQAVPASTSYEAVTGQELDNGLVTIGDTRSNTISGNITGYTDHANKVYTIAPFDWETLELKIGSTTITATGNDLVVGQTIVGSCSPENGIIRFGGSIPFGVLWASYKVAPYHNKTGSTYGTEITSSNQSLVYTHQFVKPFVRGSVVVKYVSMGELYVFYDNGLGVLEGDGGGGTIDFLNRTVTITLDSLPDVGSRVLWQASGASDETSYTGTSKFYIDIYQNGDDHSTANTTLTWDVGGTTHTHTGDTSSEGELVVTDYGFKFYPNTLIAKGTTINVETISGANKYTHVVDKSTEFTGASVVFNIGGAVEPNTVKIVSYNWIYPPYLMSRYPWLTGYQSSIMRVIYDDGSGGLYLYQKDANEPVIECGTVDYATGDFTINVKNKITKRTYVNNGGGDCHYEYSVSVENLTSDTAGNIVVYAQSDAVTEPPENTSMNVTAINLPLYNEDIPIQGKLTDDHIAFKFNNEWHISIDGVVCATGDYNIITPKGSLDAFSGVVVMDTWEDVANIATDVYAHYQGNEDQFDTEISWFVKGAPLQHGSIAGTVVLNDDTIAHFSSDNTDQITSIDSDITGNVYTDTGFVSITSTANSMSVKSLTYTAVIQQVIPVNPDVIKMNTVRLPIDGRMPVYRAGDLVVILHNQVTSATYATGDVVNMRQETNYVTIKDSTDAYVDVSKYTIDWGAKTITWDDVAGVAMPVTIMDRVENLRVVSKVRNDGKLTLQSGVSYPFPANETLVCSALIHTTMYASHTTPFDQQTTSDWSDSVTGNPATGNWNVTLKPITLTNQGTIDERWMIVFRSTGNVDVIGEKLGYVLQNADPQVNIAPINPFQQVPYFVIEGGSFVGFTSGQVIRFNTNASAQPYWLMESVSIGEATDTSVDANRLCVEFRGAVDV